MQQAQATQLNKVNDLLRNAGFSPGASGVSRNAKLQDSRIRYVFSPALVIDIGDRKFEAKEIPQGRLMVIQDEPYGTRNEDTDGEVGGWVEVDRNAKHIAEELTRAYASSGVVLIHALTGYPEEVAGAIAADLLDGVEKDTAAALLRHLKKIVLPSDTPDVIRHVHTEMLQATVNAIAVIDSKRLAYVKQMKVAATSGKGPTSADPLMERWCYTLEKDTPDDLEEQISRMREQPAPVIIQQAGIPASSVEQGVCSRCNNDVPLRDGKFPRICGTCGGNPLEFAGNEDDALTEMFRADAETTVQTPVATSEVVTEEAAQQTASTNVRTGSNPLASAVPDLAPRAARGGSNKSGSSGSGKKKKSQG
jgi:hypothetical protein